MARRRGGANGRHRLRTYVEEGQARSGEAPDPEHGCRSFRKKRKAHQARVRLLRVTGGRGHVLHSPVVGSCMRPTRGRRGALYNYPALRESADHGWARYFNFVAGSHRGVRREGLDRDEGRGGRRDVRASVKRHGSHSDWGWWRADRREASGGERESRRQLPTPRAQYCLVQGDEGRAPQHEHGRQGRVGWWGDDGSLGPLTTPAPQDGSGLVVWLDIERWSSDPTAAEAARVVPWMSDG